MDIYRELENLRRLADETRAILDRHGERFWSDWLQSRVEALTAAGPIGASDFSAGWGGMGGFSDLEIQRLNGHLVAEADVHSVNERLDELRAEMFRCAERIRTNL